MSIKIYDLCQSIPQVNESGKYAPNGDAGTVADGYTPKRPHGGEGLRQFTPEELCSLIVPVVSVNGSVRGYQRPFRRQHARKIAVALLEGKRIPEITVAVDGNGVMSVVDGQHRAVAAVIAGTPIEGIVRRMNKEEQRQLFADQRKAASVDRNVLILAGTGPYERYIQDAVSNNDHPWSQIVSSTHGSKTRISPYSMMRLLGFYVGNAGSQQITRAAEARWDEALADEMAPLVSCFGNKQSNPPAFRASALHGIGAASMYVFRRNDHVQSGDHERWIEHMPKFPWERWMHIRLGHDFTFQLVAHWNKRLSEVRRVRV